VKTKFRYLKKIIITAIKTEIITKFVCILLFMLVTVVLRFNAFKSITQKKNHYFCLSEDDKRYFFELKKREAKL
jgi:hypothetical protein